jgi:hypothetical protein
MTHDTDNIDETDNDQSGEGEDCGDDLINADYVYPSAARLIQISNALRSYNSLVGMDPYDGPESRDAADVVAKHELANAMCEEFARLERVSPSPGTTMMLYEGMILATMWDLRNQIKSKNRYKEYAQFLLTGVIMLLCLSTYLMVH